MNGGISSSISRRAQSAPEPGGPSVLWPEKTKKSAVEVLDVDRPVGHGLGAVDEHERAGRVGLARSSPWPG